MQDNPPDALAEGRRALTAGEWGAARAAFASVLDAGESPEALDGYGLALWFLGEIDEGMELRQRACADYAQAGEADRAARVAVWISHQYLISGRASVANGWLARAERVLEEAEPCAGHGWVAVERARRAASVEACLEQSRHALEIAAEHGDDDLEVFALSVLGRAEISAGLYEEGMARLEEAMAAATAGRVRNPHTLGEAYCNLVAACAAAGDWERAAEWCEHIDEFAYRRGIVPLYGACRTIHADVLVASGRWNDAETALEDALAAHARHYPAMAGSTVSTLALLRIRQGRLAEAEQLLSEREERVPSLLALAELRLAEGEPAVAASLLERALASAEGDLLADSRLLVPLVDARLASGEADAAREASSRLDELAARSERPLVAARADLAGARAELALGHLEAARERASAALAAFGGLGMPHEAAEARLELARTLVEELPQLARDEARLAFTTFKDLGAARGMDAAAAVLRDAGAGPFPGARSYGELTVREREVLALVANGMTNARIAKTLFISEKTAGHHVSRILSKLGVRNRAEAAAYAARLAGPAERSSE
ncbi:MAG TPA: LuxR C-terminal-related transcriptional regulator [Gaiellaceae bacterium]|nr:LuxR C-terminal-related transcriptional regulator [Gaiellaceae bacterium]